MTCVCYTSWGAIPRFIYIKLYDQAIYRPKYGDGFYNSMIDDKDGHIPSPLFRLTCTVLRHAVLEWQMNKWVHPKASKPKLNADIPDHSNYFNPKNDGGKNTSCCGAQVVNRTWHCRHIHILDEYLEHTTGELPTEGVQQHSCSSQASDPTCGESKACRGDQHGSSTC